MAAAANVVSMFQSMSLADRASMLALLQADAQPRTSGATVFDAREAAQLLAGQVFKDLFELGSLDRQREILGPLLRAPLPLSSVDAASDVLAVLASELFPFEGSFEAFSRALDKTVAGREQLHHVLAVTQASGSGKTKLAYAEGDKSSLVILIRVMSQTGTLLPAWVHYLDFVKQLAAERERLSAASKIVVSETALAAMRLLVMSYVEWVYLVLRSVIERLDASPKEGEAAACAGGDGDGPGGRRGRTLRLAALRCLRNGRGDDAVGRLFQSRLAELSCMSDAVTTDGSSVRMVRVSDAEVKRRVAELNTSLRALLWPYARVVLWYDEAQMLMDSGAHVFMRLTADYDAGEGDGKPQGVLYGLTALMRSLTDKPTHWRQVICGPWLELSERVRLPAFSCVQERVLTLHHAAVITEEDMATSISRYFDVGELPEPLVAYLRRLRGRPKWFFDTFWQELWSRIGTAWSRPDAATSPALTREALLTHLTEAARAAAAAINSTADEMVEVAWLNTEERAPRHSMAVLCRELYAALKLNDGCVTLHNGAASDAIRFGLLALQPASGGGEMVQMHDEPCIAGALERRGDACVRAAATADDDPVFQLLEASLQSGRIASFGLTVSVKGPVLELLFVWGVLRTRICLGDVATVVHALEPYADGCDWPDAIRNRLAALRLSATRACTPRRADACAEYLEVAARSSSTVLFGIHHNAGADVLLVADDAEGGRTLIVVQAKAQQQASLVDCLQSASPAWQYTTDKQRHALVSGRWDAVADRTSARKAFDDLAAAAPLSSMLAGAVRVALCVNGFAAHTIAACHAVNEHAELRHSPVVLCSVMQAAERSARLRPARLTAALVRSCQISGVSHPVAHPTGPASTVFWMPHAVAEIADAFAAKGRVAALPDDLRL